VDVADLNRKSSGKNWNFHNTCVPMFATMVLLAVSYIFMAIQSYLTSEVKEATDVVVMIIMLPPITLGIGFLQMIFVSIFCGLFTWVVREGYHKVSSWNYTAFLVYQLALANMDENGSVYQDTVVYHNILQCIGAKIGKYTEFQGNAFQGMPSLMRMGEGSFVGGGSFVFTYQMKRDSVYLAPATFHSAFLGNDSITAPGATLEYEAFVGSLTPILSDITVPAGEVWQGNPPMKMGSRPVNNISDGTDSVCPESRWIFLRRWIIESIGWWGGIVNGYMEDFLLAIFLHMIIDGSTGEVKLEKVMISLPAIRFISIFLSFFTDWAAKWAMFGVIDAGEHGLWSCWLLSYMMYQSIFSGNSTFYVPDICGTPLVIWWFRSLGAKIGKNVFLYSTEFTEWDLVTIGDNVALNVGVTIQPHTYEDRVFKMGTVTLMEGATIHAITLLLPGTLLEESAEVLPMSLPFTGETVSRGTWHGNPVVRIKHFEPPLTVFEGYMEQTRGTPRTQGFHKYERIDDRPKPSCFAPLERPLAYPAATAGRESESSQWATSSDKKRHRRDQKKGNEGFQSLLTGHSQIYGSADDSAYYVYAQV